MIRSLVLPMLLALPTVVIANGSDCVDYRALFDPAASKDARGSQVVALEREAERGSSAARYVLGLLHLRGLPQVPEGMLRDVAKAESLLARAAVSGRMEALAAMTEVALAKNDDREAAAWAQLSGYYARKARGRVAPGLELYSMRNIGAVRRFLGSKNGARLSIEYMGGLIERHDASIQRGIDAGPEIDHVVCGADSPARLVPEASFYFDEHRARKVEERKRRRAAFADYSVGSDLMVALLEVSGDGSVRQTYSLRWLGPSKDPGPAMEAARRFRFQAFGEAGDTRWAIAPVTAWTGDRARED